MKDLDWKWPQIDTKICKRYAKLMKYQCHFVKCAWANFDFLLKIWFFFTTFTLSSKTFCPLLISSFVQVWMMDNYFLVMGRTPFYWTSIELEHHFSKIEWTRTCSFVNDRTRTPYFWLRTIEHQTSNLIGLSIN